MSTARGVSAGALATGGIVGVSAGLAIGLIFHAGTSISKTRTRKKNSPYRFLTTLEKAGVVFQSEADLRPQEDAEVPKKQL